MTHITVVVRDGMLADVYSDCSDVKVDLIDFDAPTDEEYDAANKALLETKQTMLHVW